MDRDFELVGPIFGIETIAIGRRIRDLLRIRKSYGAGRWRKQKGIGQVILPSGSVRLAELHWYEARGIGRREMKIKRLLPDE